MSGMFVPDSAFELIQQIKSMPADKYDHVKESDPALYYAYKAVEVEPWTMPYREHLVNMLIRRDEYNEALNIIEDGLRGYGAWWTGYELKGIILKELGDVSGALENFSIAMNNDPTPARGCQYVEICIEYGKIDMANNIIDNILKGSPKMAAMYYYRSLIAKKLANPQAALEYIHTAIEYDKNNLKYKSLLVEIMLMTNEPRQALQYIMDNLNRHSNWADAYYYMAVILRQFGKLNEALECAKQACEIDPGKASFAALLGDLARLLGKTILIGAESDEI